MLLCFLVFAHRLPSCSNIHHVAMFSVKRDKHAMLNLVMSGMFIIRLFATRAATNQLTGQNAEPRTAKGQELTSRTFVEKCKRQSDIHCADTTKVERNPR